MNKKIIVDSKGYEKLTSTFRKSRQTIWKALNFKTQSDLSDQIRCMATKQLGGVIIYDSDNQTNNGGHSKSILCQDSFVDTGDKLVQTYDNGVSLIIEKYTGTIKINGRNGLPNTIFENASVKQIAAGQELAKTLII